MAIFREHLVRSGLTAAGVALGAYFLTRLLPETLRAFNLMQSSVAILALASLAVLVITHHRRQGEILTQTQEEMILIGAFGLFWFAIFVGMRSFRGVDTDNFVDAMHSGMGSGGAVSSGVGGVWESLGCDSNAHYCVTEEWNWY